jgi:CHAT domain
MIALVFLGAVTHWIQAHRHLIDAWRHYSEDKWSSRPSFSNYGGAWYDPLVVGFLQANGSRCDGPRSRPWTADGVIGLGHAFLEAGARTVILSWWAVSDAATASLTDTFYQVLLDDAALRRADAAMPVALPATRSELQAGRILDRNGRPLPPAPANWAASAVLGNGRSNQIGEGKRMTRMQPRWLIEEEAPLDAAEQEAMELWLSPAFGAHLRGGFNPEHVLPLAIRVRDIIIHDNKKWFGEADIRLDALVVHGRMASTQRTKSIPPQDF